MTSAVRGKEGGSRFLTIGGWGCVISILRILTRGGGGPKYLKFSWRHLWMAPKAGQISAKQTKLLTIPASCASKDIQRHHYLRHDINVGFPIVPGHASDASSINFVGLQRVAKWPPFPSEFSRKLPEPSTHSLPALTQCPYGSLNFNLGMFISQNLFICAICPVSFCWRGEKFKFSRNIARAWKMQLPSVARRAVPAAAAWFQFGFTFRPRRRMTFAKWYGGDRPTGKSGPHSLHDMELCKCFMLLGSKVHANGVFMCLPSTNVLNGSKSLYFAGFDHSVQSWTDFIAKQFFHIVRQNEV